MEHSVPLLLIAGCALVVVGFGAICAVVWDIVLDRRKQLE